MHVELSPKYQSTHEGIVAQQVIAKCVHCGFCNATCPTYQLLGDELDGPRGRIYQIKQVLEGATPTAELALHLDRCLTCRNCETTCPSGVEYHNLLDVGRALVEPTVSRGKFELTQKWLLRKFLSQRVLMTPLMRLAQYLRPPMPGYLKKNIPAKQEVGEWPPNRHTRKMLILEGCVQPGMKPLTNTATARVLDRLGISVIKEPKEGCCGALSFHLNAQEEARTQMRKNIDAWWPHIENGIEAIISTASGCGVMVKDYAHVLADDANYAEKAQTIQSLTKDLSQVINNENLACLKQHNTPAIAFHSPCTLQHGQQLAGVVESILCKCGYSLTPIKDSHLCCGSAGTYSIFQKKIATHLRTDKINAIETGQPQIIATANIGCQLHLQGATQLPVAHWIELLDQ